MVTLPCSAVPSTTGSGSHRPQSSCAATATCSLSGPVWLFSVATVGDQDSMLAPTVTRILRRLGTQPKGLAAFREIIHPQDHHGFVGAVERDHYPLVGRLVYRAMGGRYGDHRNWNEIDVWADGIARQLAARQRNRQT